MQLALKVIPSAFTPAHPMPPELLRPLFNGTVSAGHSGFASPADAYLQPKLDLNQRFVTNTPATYYFTVKGNSMNKARVYDGDLAIVDASVTPKSSDIVVAEVEGEWMVKRLYKRGSVIKLLPDSDDPSHKPVVFSDGQELRVFGVVKYVIAKPV
jgi:DNA polymerase V